MDLFRTAAKEFLLFGGSRSGKSFIIIYKQIVWASVYPGSRHLIARFRFNHAKNSIWMDTLKKVFSICFPKLAPHIVWNNTDYFIRFPNKSEIWIAGLDDKDRSEKILGMEFLTVFLNEASQISYNAYNTIKTRLAQKIEGARPTLFVDANPPSKKHWMYKVFVENVDPEQNTTMLNPDRYAWIKMNPDDNLENISADYLETLDSMSQSKRKRFRDGDFSDDSEAALWSDDLISATRVRKTKDGKVPVTLKRIVVAIDPAVSSRDTSDETGIVVAGIGFDDHLYVLDDDSGTYTPNEWATRAIALYNKWEADRVVGEVNNGGDLIEAMLRNVEAKVSYKGVHATRDKLTRAEPIAAIYEQGKAHHIDQLLELELEMTTWEAKKGEKSPNRIDALVWAATELCLSGSVIKGRAKFHFGSKK